MLEGVCTRAFFIAKKYTTRVYFPRSYTIYVIESIREIPLKFNQATDYAFRIILYMSTLPFGTRKVGAELARTSKIPERFLLKIMRYLVNAKLLHSYRGVDGGFSLAKKPKDINLYDVVTAVEGDTYLQHCLYDSESCSRGCQGQCAVQEAVGKIQAVLIEELQKVDFETLAKRERSIHISLHHVV